MFELQDKRHIFKYVLMRKQRLEKVCSRIGKLSLRTFQNTNTFWGDWEISLSEFADGKHLFASFNFMGRQLEDEWEGRKRKVWKQAGKGLKRAWDGSRLHRRTPLRWHSSMQPSKLFLFPRENEICFWAIFFPPHGRYQMNRRNSKVVFLISKT